MTTDFDNGSDGNSQRADNQLAPLAQRATAHYEALRLELQSLHAADVPDEKAIDAVIDRLAAAQLAVKAAHGLIGNNPNE